MSSWTELDTPIPDDCVIYRIVKWSEVKDGGVPQSSNFSDKGEYMSVCAHDGLAVNNWSIDDVLEKWDKSIYTFVWFYHHELVKSGERLWRAPDDAYPGHTACKRQDGSVRTGGQKRKLARLARGPSQLPI